MTTVLLINRMTARILNFQTPLGPVWLLDLELELGNFSQFSNFSQFRNQQQPPPSQPPVPEIGFLDAGIGISPLHSVCSSGSSAVRLESSTHVDPVQSRLEVVQRTIPQTWTMSTSMFQRMLKKRCRHPKRRSKPLRKSTEELCLRNRPSFLRTMKGLILILLIGHWESKV